MKKLAMYLRLSKEDEYTYDESNSISNQRALISRFIRSNPELKKMDVMEFKDDGYTGKNLNRPGMQDLLAMIKGQKIGCVVVKDISRFSRDHLETGKYLEQIFPFMGVRFIAINDNYDSKDFVGGIGEIDVAFKGILYDFYSEDLSEKVKSSFAVSRAQGKYQATVAPYGYRKNPENKHQLLVDEEAACIVRRIFKEYVGGASAYGIAQCLNMEGVATPADYIKQTTGYDFQKKYKGKILWSTGTVTRILKNEFYIGTYVYHRNAVVAVGSKTKKLLDPSEWKRVEDNHEALVSREDFNAAQERLSRYKSGKAPVAGHPLAGMVECGICGHHLYHIKSGRPHYKCVYSRYNPGMEHEKNSIHDTELEKTVLAALQRHLDLRADRTAMLTERRKIQQGKADGEEKKLRELQSSLDKLQREQMEAFEAYKNGLTDRETFMQQKKLYDGQEAKLITAIAEQAEVVKVLDREIDRMPEGLSAGEDRIATDELTKELVDAFVERVIITPGKPVMVRWKFDR